MADDPQAPQPETPTSYSDPIYDRLETVVREFGRRWLLIVIIAALTVALVITLQQMEQQTPQAASAHAFSEAQEEGVEALSALVDNAGATAEFRGRAAIEAAALRLQDGNVEAARAVLERARPLVEEADRRGLELDLLLSEAAVHEAADELDEAIAAYRRADQRAGQQRPVHSVSATLGVARCQIAQAAASDDPEQATELRRQAISALSAVAGRRMQEGAGALASLARFQRESLKRRYPELREQDDGAAGAAADEAQPDGDAEGDEAPAE